MATFTMPYYLKPLLDFYSLKWPDIDEDKVAELGTQIQDVANSTHIFALAVQRCLGELSEEAHSDALETLHGEWSKFTAGPVDAVSESFGDGAVSSCLFVANGITGYKGSVLAILTVNAATDLALIVSGVGAPAAVAKKALLRGIIEEGMDALARQTADWLVGQWNDFCDEHIFSHIESLAADVRNDVAGAAANVVSMAVPLHSAEVSAAALYIDHDDVIQAAGHLMTAYTNLMDAVSKLQAWTKGSGYTSPVAVAAPDPTLRHALEAALDWACDQILQLIDDIGNAIVNNMVDTITGIYDKYVEADQTLGGLAGQLREQFRFPPPSVPFLIDRSDRPKPIFILDAPPMVVTGPGVSDARNGIVVIDLPDAPEPVITGVAESDARLDIRKILLPQSGADEK